MSIFLLPLAITSMISSGLISITRPCIEINARPVNLSSPIVFLKYVFTRFKVEKLLSLVAVVIGSVAKREFETLQALNPRCIQLTSQLQFQVLTHTSLNFQSKYAPKF